LPIVDCRLPIFGIDVAFLLLELERTIGNRKLAIGNALIPLSLLDWLLQLKKS